jgi:hypothetical protein
MSIAEELGIYDYNSYNEIPVGKRAWITIKAKQRGDNPVMVHAGIKATFVKRLNKRNSCSKCPLCGK